MSSVNRAARRAAAVLCAVPVLWSGAAASQEGWEAPPAARLPEEARSALVRFESFLGGVSDLSPRLRSGLEVADAVRKGGAYEPQQFSEGMILYAALAAAEAPDFVDAARRRARAVGREAMIAELVEAPQTAARLAGAREAEARAAAALRREAERLAAGGRAMKQASYDVQAQAWSRAFTPEAARLLAEVKRLGDAPRPAPAVATPAGYGGGPWLIGAGAVTRAVALAAAMAIGEPADSEAVRPLAGDPAAGQCLRMAKLNYHMCLSAAGPYYEGVYCLAQHAMLEPAQCLTRAAGAS
ncbi:MAG: hypothetical protein ACOY4K_07450 [Pseudomonadota bacterium]